MYYLKIYLTKSTTPFLVEVHHCLMDLSMRADVVYCIPGNLPNR